MKKRVARLFLSLFLAFALAVPTVVVSNPVSAEAASAKLNKKQVLLGVGGTFTLKVTGTTAKSFKSNKTSVATVTKAGKITAKKKGTATISVKCANGKTYKCTVEVVAKKAANTYYLVEEKEENMRWGSTTIEKYDYDKNGNVILDEFFSYDGDELESTNKSEYTYHKNGEKATDTYFYSDGGKYVEKYDESGAYLGYEQYDEYGNLIGSYTAGGYDDDYYYDDDIYYYGGYGYAEPTVTYDDNGRVIQETSCEFDYDAYDYMHTCIDYEYDANGNVVKTVTKYSFRSDFSYVLYEEEETFDADGNVKSSRIDHGEYGYDEYIYDEYGDWIVHTSVGEDWYEETKRTLTHDAEGRITKNVEVEISQYEAYDWDTYKTYTVKEQSSKVETFTFDANGKEIMLVSESTDSDGEVRKYTKETKYDANGNKTNVNYVYGIGTDSEHSEEYVYEYNAQGQLIKETSYNAGVLRSEYFYSDGSEYYDGYFTYNSDGSLDYGYKYEYDDEGNRISYTSVNAGEIEVTTYSEKETKRVRTVDGKVTYVWTDVTETAADGSYTRTQTVEEDGEKYISYFESVDKYGNTTYEVRYYGPEDLAYEYKDDYVYDKKGNLLKHTWDHGYGETTYEWTYDKNGNKTKKTETDDGGVYRVTTYTWKTLKNICTK